MKSCSKDSKDTVNQVLKAVSRGKRRCREAEGTLHSEQQLVVGVKAEEGTQGLQGHRDSRK